MSDVPTVLVVDDQPINVNLLQRKLERAGMKVLSAYNGRECLEIIENTIPDLILLDIMMPEMDGIEVCRQLKANEDTEAIPIIFITAKSTKEGKLQGLSAGAADYITKPIDLEETLARVKTQLRIQNIYRQNIELQLRLAETRQSAAVGAITQGIAHNLNNLLGVVVGYIDLIKSGYESSKMVKRSALLMEQAVQRMINIIRQLTTIANKEKVNLYPRPLNTLLHATIERFKNENNLNGNVSIETSTPNLQVSSNAEVFESIVGQLLLNAWESYGEDHPENDRQIKIETELTEKYDNRFIAIKVSDQGVGIDDEIEDHIFEPFITNKTAIGRGMGLTIARHSIRNIGGELNLERIPEGGTRAILLHPL